MNIEQEIWEDFTDLSDYCSSKRLSYAGAKAGFGIDYEDTISSLYNPTKGQFIRNDPDGKIEKLLADSNIDWAAILKLYPQREFKPLARGVQYPPAKFRSNKERRSIEEFLVDGWMTKKEEIYAVFPTERKALKYLKEKRWGGKPFCPHCGYTAKIYLLDTPGTPYKCSSCRKKFSDTVGTIFTNTKLPLTKWYEGIYLFTDTATKKISTLQLSRALEISQKTAWLMAKNIQCKVNQPFIENIKSGLLL